MAGWLDRGMAGWLDRGMAGWRDGGMAGWRDSESVWLQIERSRVQVLVMESPMECEFLA